MFDTSSAKVHPGLQSHDGNSVVGFTERLVKA
jgi:hypothetical protein